MKDAQVVLNEMASIMPYKLPAYLNPYVSEAMNIYAREVGISFIEWVKKGNYTYHASFRVWVRFTTERYTTDELFTLFLIQQK